MKNRLNINLAHFFKIGLLFVLFFGLSTLPAVAGKKNDTLTVAWTNETNTLDPFYHVNMEGLILDRHILDTLIYRDAETGEYKPLLSKSWKWIDNQTIDFVLREGIKFHNGEPFDADDVVFTFNYGADPANKILNFGAFKRWKGAEKLSQYKVRVFLKKPYPPALEIFAGSVAIVPNEYYAKVGTEGFGLNPIGTGPYKVTKVIPGEEYTLVKNKDYFKDSPKGHPSIGKIIVKELPEQNSIIAGLMTGAVDWMWKLSEDQMNHFKKIPKLQIDQAETMRIGFLLYNSKETSAFPMLKKIKVRQALTHAIDRESMSKNLVGSGSQVIHSPCYPKQFGCNSDDVQTYEYNPKKAKELLSEAGYPNGFKLKLYAWRERPYNEAVISYWKAIGVETELMYMKVSAVDKHAYANKVPVSFQVIGSRSINDASVPLGYAFKFSPDDQVRDAQVRDFLDEGDVSTDPEVRKSAYKKALDRIAEQCLVTPMFTYVQNYAFTRELDFKAAADDYPLFFLAKWK